MERKRSSSLHSSESDRRDQKNVVENVAAVCFFSSTILLHGQHLWKCHHFAKFSSLAEVSSFCKTFISCANFITLQKFHHVVKLHHLWHVQHFKDVCKLATLWVPMAAYDCPLRVQQVSGIKLCNCLAILKQQEQSVLWEELSEENAVVKQKETNAWRKKRNINALCVGAINASKRQAFA